MPFTLLLALAAAAQPTPPPRTCPLIWPVAPDEQAARRIAEAVIAADPEPDLGGWILRVRLDPADRGSWMAWQVRPHRRPILPSDRTILTDRVGGGGLDMRIDRCTGAISRLYYAR